MKKPSWCEKHFIIGRAVSELQNLSSHFNRTALYAAQELKFSQILSILDANRSKLGSLKKQISPARDFETQNCKMILNTYSKQILRTIWNSYSHGTYFFPV